MRESGSANQKRISARRVLPIAATGLVALLPWRAAYAAESNPSDNTVTLAFMGDTMLGRLVSEAIPHREPASFWGDTLPLLQACDLRLLNLETSVTTTSQKWSEWRKAFYYKAVPQATGVLLAADIDYVTLANNHVLDYSEPGLEDTIRFLDRAGIQHTGAGNTPDQAWRTIQLSVEGTRVGVFSFADHYHQWDVERGEPGIAYTAIPPSNVTWQRIEKIIDELREGCDIVVCSVHWGPNMVEFPSRERVKLAHRLVDAGVDVIHGHSAHVFQGVEIYRGAVILYDTGEYIDDYAIRPDLRNDLSFLYRLRWNNNGWSHMELTPVVIDNMSVAIARDEDMRRALSLFDRRTKPFDTQYSVESGRITIPISDSNNPD